jgi:hypothetical protein
MNVLESMADPTRLGGRVTSVNYTMSDEEVINKAYTGAILVECVLDFPLAGR